MSITGLGDALNLSALRAASRSVPRDFHTTLLPLTNFRIYAIMVVQKEISSSATRGKVGHYRQSFFSASGGSQLMVSKLTTSLEIRDS